MGYIRPMTTNNRNEIIEVQTVVGGYKYRASLLPDNTVILAYWDCGTLYFVGSGKWGGAIKNAPENISLEITLALDEAILKSIGD